MVQVVVAAEVVQDQPTCPAALAGQQEAQARQAPEAILDRVARVDTQEVPALRGQAVIPVALGDQVLEELPVLVATLVVLVVTLEEVPAGPVQEVTQALELKDLALADTLDLEPVDLVLAAIQEGEATALALALGRALVDPVENQLADLAVQGDQAVTVVLVAWEALVGPVVLVVMVVPVVPAVPVVLEAPEDLVVTVVPVVPVAPEDQAVTVVRVGPVVPEVPLVMVVRVVPAVPEGLAVTVALVVQEVLEVLEVTVVPVAPVVLVDLGVLVVRKDQVVPRDQGASEGPEVLVVQEAPVVMEATEDPEQVLEPHLVALAHTWRVVVLVLGLIPALVPRLPKVDRALRLADMVSFHLGLARRRPRIQVHQEPMPIRAQAPVQAHQEPVHNPEEVERGRDLSTRAPMLALVAAVVATTRPTAGPTRAVPHTPDRTLPASYPAVLPRGREEEVGAAGRRVATGHL